MKIMKRIKKIRKMYLIAWGGVAAMLVLLLMFPLLMLNGKNDTYFGEAIANCTLSEESNTAVDELLAEAGYNPKVSTKYVLAVWSVGHEMELQRKAKVIALVTIMQESSLTMLANKYNEDSLNLPHDAVGDDHDSVGLFQQREPWGSTEQRMDPKGSATLFYEALLREEGWETMEVGVAAQAVQVSAFPDEYAKHEPLAEKVASAIVKNLTCDSVSTGQWVPPLPGTQSSSDYRTPQRPDHRGVDLMADKGTPILAASAGTVAVVMCHASTRSGSPLSCDVDGSPSINGCGWYVDITHEEDKATTRYCHMWIKPFVSVGDEVAPGDVIGEVGNSGNSSGPHLHFETHTSMVPSRINNTDADPVEFMADRGVKL